MSVEQKDKANDINISSELKIDSVDEKSSLINNKKFSQFWTLQNKSTLNEPVSTTLYRDLFRIFLKIKYTLNPFLKNDEKRFLIYDWDLWGPLLFTILLSLNLAINSINKGACLVLIFSVFWLGGAVLYLNGNFLGVNMYYYYFIIF